MIATIHQPQYLPWLGYFDKADRADVFILLDNVQFKKNEWQNRNKIRTSQGWQWLTVPIIHDFGQDIQDVKINNKENWRRAHLKSIQLNYCKAPFYEQYIGTFVEAYDRNWDLLSDLNTHFIKILIELLGIKTKIVKASEHEVTPESTQRLVDLCKIFKVDSYYAGRDGQKYMDFEQFKLNKIKVVTQDFNHPVYKQQWGGKGGDEFLSHLSIIDLLFNHGDDSLAIIRQKKKVVNT